jgi:hypothetical protein
LGVLFDADQPDDRRWQRLRAACLRAIPDLPEELPREGLITKTVFGPRLGFWMMPDNQSRGMLETFLHCLVPATGPESLWAFAGTSCDAAKSDYAAPFNDLHLDKAKIYTWLAWQDTPGQQLHQAILTKQLDPRASGAQDFVRWFRRLFDV